MSNTRTQRMELGAFGSPSALQNCLPQHAAAAPRQVAPRVPPGGSGAAKVSGRSRRALPWPHPPRPPPRYLCGIAVARLSRGQMSGCRSGCCQVGGRLHSPALPGPCQAHPGRTCRLSAGSTRCVTVKLVCPDPATPSPLPLAPAALPLGGYTHTPPATPAG